MFGEAPTKNRRLRTTLASGLSRTCAALAAGFLLAAATAVIAPVPGAGTKAQYPRHHGR